MPNTYAAYKPHTEGHFVEKALMQAILSPEPNLDVVAELASQLHNHPGALDRAMFNAIYHGPKVLGGQGAAYLEIVDVLLEIGVELPPAAAWIAYADQLTARTTNHRAQEMTRLLLRRGSTGVPALNILAARWPEHTQAHTSFLESLG